MTTSSIPAAQLEVEAERRQATETDAAAYIRRTQGANADLLLDMLGLDTTVYPVGVCRRCGSDLPQDRRANCRRKACREAATQEAAVLAAGVNMPLPKSLA